MKVISLFAFASAFAVLLTACGDEGSRWSSIEKGQVVTNLSQPQKDVLNNAIGFIEQSRIQADAKTNNLAGTALANDEKIAASRFDQMKTALVSPNKTEAQFALANKTNFEGPKTAVKDFDIHASDLFNCNQNIDGTGKGSVEVHDVDLQKIEKRKARTEANVANCNGYSGKLTANYDSLSDEVLERNAEKGIWQLFKKANESRMALTGKLTLKDQEGKGHTVEFKDCGYMEDISATAQRDRNLRVYKNPAEQVKAERAAWISSTGEIIVDGIANSCVNAVYTKKLGGN